MEVTLLFLVRGRLNYIVSSSLESRLWFDLYLGCTTVATLEVRKLPKIDGVAYLEGRFKSNKYGTPMKYNHDTDC